MERTSTRCFSAATTPSWTYGRPTGQAGHCWCSRIPMRTASCRSYFRIMTKSSWWIRDIIMTTCRCWFQIRRSRTCCSCIIWTRSSATVPSRTCWRESEGVPRLLFTGAAPEVVKPFALVREKKQKSPLVLWTFFRFGDIIVLHVKKYHFEPDKREVRGGSRVLCMVMVFYGQISCIQTRRNNKWQEK